MSTKRLTKLLMAEGVQRNDAAAFVEIYRKMRNRAVIKLFPELVAPPAVVIPPRRIEPSCFVSQIAQSKMELNCTADRQQWIKRRLVENMMQHLLNSGMVEFTHKEYAAEMVFTARMQVLPPQVREVYTMGNWG